MSGSNDSAVEIVHRPLTSENIIDVVMDAALYRSKVTIIADPIDQLYLLETIKLINRFLLDKYIRIYPYGNGSLDQRISISFGNCGKITLTTYESGGGWVFNSDSIVSLDTLMNIIDEWRAWHSPCKCLTEIYEVPDELNAYFDTLIHKE